MIHSILMSEVKDMENQVLKALEKFQTKKTLKFHLEPNFYNFQERKEEEVLCGCYNILYY